MFLYLPWGCPPPSCRSSHGITDQNLISVRVSSLISQNKGFERPTDPHRSIRTTMGPPIHVGNARTARNAAIVPRHGRLGLLWCARDSSCRHPWRLQRARIALLRVLGDLSGQHETRGRDSPGHSALHPAQPAIASPRGGCLPALSPAHGLAGKSTYVPVLGRL